VRHYPLSETETSYGGFRRRRMQRKYPPTLYYSTMAVATDRAQHGRTGSVFGRWHCDCCCPHRRGLSAVSTRTGS
jgi:hypothetical protein